MHRSLVEFDAVLFDLDGVVTATASLHAAAWKATFDEVLDALQGESDERQRPFDDEDYRRYVDGKPRRDGVRSFLASRGIRLPEDAQRGSVSLTVAGVAERKNELFQARLAAGGITVFPGSLALLRQLRARGAKTAVVSASRNCRPVMATAGAGIEDLFDAVVDGESAARDGLRGKPAPDTFLAAARQLGIQPARAAVIEDAIAGVEAGRAGRFALVVGVERSGTGRELQEHGADVVVHDLAELLDNQPGSTVP